MMTHLSKLRSCEIFVAQYRDDYLKAPEERNLIHAAKGKFVNMKCLYYLAAHLKYSLSLIKKEKWT